MAAGYAISGTGKVKTFGSAAFVSAAGGVATENVFASQLIPAGTILTDSFLRISILWGVTDSGNDKTSRMYFSPTAGAVGGAVPVGALKIAEYLATAANDSMAHTREFGVRSSTSIIAIADQNIQYRDFIVGNTNLPVVITVPTFESDVYFIISGQKETAGEAMSMNFWKFVANKV